MSNLFRRVVIWSGLKYGYCFTALKAFMWFFFACNSAGNFSLTTIVWTVITSDKRCNNDWTVTSFLSFLRISNSLSNLCKLVCKIVIHRFKISVRTELSTLKCLIYFTLREVNSIHYIIPVVIYNVFYKFKLFKISVLVIWILSLFLAPLAAQDRVPCLSLFATLARRSTSVSRSRLSFSSSLYVSLPPEWSIKLKLTHKQKNKNEQKSIKKYALTSFSFSIVFKSAVSSLAFSKLWSWIKHGN